VKPPAETPNASGMASTARCIEVLAGPLSGNPHTPIAQEGPLGAVLRAVSNGGRWPTPIANHEADLKGAVLGRRACPKIAPVRPKSLS
jgi:hypothetical protein